jgi:crotonobetainyl-CoA:carnitine CoA-transferase CaiB-like acyl-CoA transferase
MSAKQTLEALDFTKEDQKVFRELDVKDKVAAMDMLKRKIKETGLTAEEAEARLWKNGACTAMVRTRDECLQTEQGKLLAKMPLIVTDSAGSVAKPAGKPNFNPLQPLAGLKIVDMSRILAGPHASKLLASLGATVLKISHPPDIDTFIMDTSLGKRSAILDLKKEADRNVFLDEILPDTDILIQGYRSGKLDKLGLGFSQLSSKIDSLIASGLRSPTRPLYYASENCYGPSGPLSHHGGWEQIAQAFTGLALPLNAEKPRMLPLTVLDMMTGGALALGILAALLKPTGHTHIQTSLCQTAFYIQSFGVRTEVAVDRRLPADLIGEKDVASMTPALLKMLQPTLDPLLATNPGWFGQHEKGARGNLGFLRPAFGLQTNSGPVYGRWKWSSRVNGHDPARWVRDEEAGDGDAEMGGSVVWSGVDARL